MLDFPASPSVGQKYPASPLAGIPTYTWDGEKWTTIGGAVSGGTAVCYDIVQSLTAAQQQQARQNIGSPVASLVINGDFRVNQVGYVSAAALAAGAYGHDQWKAGASGGDYSFTQLKSSTQITIASGKSLIQPVEDVNVSGGSYVLSWTGTAQARAGVNTLTPSGSYAGSPLLITGQTAGTAMSVEFNSGTLGSVKLESGAKATPFVMRPYDQELVMCQRYWRAFLPGGAGLAATGGNVRFQVQHHGMRATPTASVSQVMTVSNIGTANFTQSAANVSIIAASADGGEYSFDNFTGLTPSAPLIFRAGGILRLDARL